MRIDLHQHIWTEPLLDALSARSYPPFVRRTQEGLTILHSAQERPYIIDVTSESVTERTRLLHSDRVDLAMICLSSPVGIEALSPPEARELIDAHLDGVSTLGDRFAAWGPLPIETPHVADVDDMLERGCLGISVPATALAGPDALCRIGPVLERVQAHDVTLFIHPGGAVSQGTAEASLTEPLWWRALTDYVSQMQAAWLTFATCGRRDLPRLKVVFAMLAGGAPLLHERLLTRGGPAADLHDPLTFYDTSSYGPQLVDMMARWVGHHVSLSTQELEGFTAWLAASPERWRHLVRHDDDARVYEQIWDDHDVNAWLICWSEDQDTGFHDHDDSAAGIVVVSGHVREDRLTMGCAPRSRKLGPGSTFAVPPVAIHRVRHAGVEPAVTIHAYSPPLRRTGAYRLGPGGTLEREAQASETELRGEPALT